MRSEECVMSEECGGFFFQSLMFCALPFVRQVGFVLLGEHIRG